MMRASRLGIQCRRVITVLHERVPRELKERKSGKGGGKNATKRSDSVGRSGTSV